MLPEDPVGLAFVIGYAVSAVVSFGIAAYLYENRWERPVRRTFGLLALSVGGWATGNLLRVFVPSLAAKQGVHLGMYAFIYATSILFLVFTLQYTGYGNRVTRRFMGAIVAVPFVGWLTLLTNPTHHWFYRRVALDMRHGIPVLTTDVAAAFWLFTGYNWLLFLVGSFLLIHFVLLTHPRYRVYAATILVGVAIPWTANVAYLTGTSDLTPLDPTPVFVALGVLPIAVVVTRTGMLDVIPLARDRVLEAVDVSFLVIDNRDRIVDLDATAGELIGADDDTESVIGSRAPDILPADLWSAITADRPEVEWELPAGPDRETRHYLVRTRSIAEAADRPLGRVVAFTDVTARVRQRQELESKTDRLDEFASMLSHDLRNPLNVAQGRLALLSQNVESDHLGPIDEAHERMEELIEDMLTLARSGEAIGEREAVQLSDVVESCWQSVATGSAQIVNEADGRVIADASRLRQLLENLFRNAVEHGGEDVTITVGDLPDGFYVVDDGVGMPPDVRTSLFAERYDEASAEIGLGLRIAQEVAEAHGWTMEVTDPDDGGARFEIRGVDRPQ